MNNQALSSPITAVVPAAGIGSRMKSECPKQYLNVAGRPLIEHSITALLKHPDVTRIVVALHPEDRWFNQLAIASHPLLLTVTGGETRAESVLAGLEVTDSEWVLVHDAARPCLPLADLTALIHQLASSSVGGLLACPVSDTIKQASSDNQSSTGNVDRERLWRALTPQLFPAIRLKHCLSKALNDGALITDEASALEYCGYQPQLVLGSSENLKVTRPEDLALAEYYLLNRQKKEKQ